MEGRLAFPVFVAFAIAIKLTPGQACDPNMQPVIGILAQNLSETDQYPKANYIAASYVKFIEMFGGRVVPIFPNKDDDYYETLQTQLSGVLFPGGEVDLYTAPYHRMATRFYKYSINLADTQQQKFPILGICLGFETLSTLAANGEHVLSPTDSRNQMSHLELSKYGEEESDLFNSAPDWLLSGIQADDIAPNYHDFSLLKTTYDQNTDIKEKFNAVAYSWDRNNLKYVAIMESKKYPMLAVQHHPEKNLFEWAPESNFAHNFLGSSYSQYFGDYFMQLARTSCQRFESEDELDKYLIYNFPVTYSQNMFKDKHFTQMYIFEDGE